MHKIKTILAAALAFALPAAAADGHGGHGGGHDGHDMSHMEDLSRFGEAGDPAKADRTVTVKASEIAFDVAALELKRGETVTFVLENDGTQDHEFGIGDAAFFAAHTKMMAAMPGMDHAMPNIATAKPGETARLTWTFSKTGDFEFACSMPGHYELGMKGTISVR